MNIRLRSRKIEASLERGSKKVNLLHQEVSLKSATSITDYRYPWTILDKILFFSLAGQKRRVNQWWHDKQSKKMAPAVVNSTRPDGPGGPDSQDGAAVDGAPAATQTHLLFLMMTICLMEDSKS